MKFNEFKSIGRMSKNCVITEKIDGTNAQVCIVRRDNIDLTSEFIESHCLAKTYTDINLAKIDDLLMFAGSRNRWIKLGDDNFGFAYWVSQNAEELFKLGEGTHYGEWAGRGIQRGYGLEEKRFYLFNTARWSDDLVRPSCCYVVPVLYSDIFTTDAVENVMAQLKEHGSYIAPFMNPEGVVVYHIATKTLFKKTFDDNHKGVKANG